MNWIHQPWPWYIAGPLIGLIVPLLLLVGNKYFGVSSTLRQICAACIPADIPFFKYDWKRELWNLFFVSGILIGGILTGLFMSNPAPVDLNPKLVQELNGYGITDFTGLIPNEVFSWHSLLTLKGILMVVLGGFLVGFGTRYAGGCTSGHAIMGLSNLQLASLIATCSFMAGGIFVANVIIPILLNL